MVLLLVEDEQHTRDGIIRFMDWNKLGIQKVYAAEDGLEGLDVARSCSPDIVLADIRMPRMNGADMAREIRKFLPDCALIFISGYSDREYLKSAIHLSALDYVSKPLDLNELHAILVKAVEHVRQKNEKEALMQSLLHNELASIMIQDKIPSGEKMRLWRESNLPQVDELILYTILIQQHYSRTTNQFIKALAEQLGIWVLVGRWDEFYLIHMAMRPDQTGLLNRFVDKILNGNHSSIDQRAVIAVGKPVDHPTKLKESFCSARAALNRHFYHPDRQLFIGQGNALSLDLGFDPTHYFKRLLIQQPSQARQWLIQQFEHIRNYDGTPIELVRNWAFQMAAVMYLLNQDWADRSLYGFTDGASLWQAIVSLPSLDQLKKFLLDGIDNIENRFCYGDSKLPLALEVQRYIHLNFTDPLLTLESIAEHVNLSPNYLCEIFKLATGQTINQYLNNCRIRHAQLLLQTTRMRIHQIASACGYSGSNYFIKVFRKLTGVTPQEYRERNSLL